MATVYGNNSPNKIGPGEPWPYFTTNRADKVYARGGNDTVDGAGGNDILYGERGNDVLTGGTGNDSLAGADWYYKFGEGERDTLTGGSGRDQFYLGTSNRNFYTGAGNSDYALITDFSVYDDIKVRGSDNYRFGYYYAGGEWSTGIYIDKSGGPSNDELIGVVQGVSPWDLTISPRNSGGYRTIDYLGLA